MDLPEDIWDLVTSHLASEDLRALISVNRTFFHAALNARYRRIVFRSKGRKELYNFTRLQDPFIASQVRVLYLVPACFLPNPSDASSGVVTKFVQATKDFIWSDNPQVNGFGTSHNVSNKMDHIFENLKHLDELGLFCRDTWAASPAAHTIVNSAWCRLSSHLRTLILDMSSLALEQALSPSLVFPRLEVLTLKTYRSYFSSDTDILRILLKISLPFITNHRQTLRNFALIDRGVTDINFSPFLQDLGYFPYLKSIDASISLDLAVPGLWHFLGLHSCTLESLDLSHYRLVEPPSYNGPALVALKVLSLHLNVYTTSFMASLQRGSYIQKLKLHSITYRYSEAPQILEIFAGDQLESLSIGLDFLHPQTVELISESFPSLRTLLLRIGGYTALGAKQGDLSQVEHLFCEAMEKKNYSHWQPPIFDIEVHRSNSTRCGDVLKKIFPQVRVGSFLVDRAIPDLELPW